jgi:HlyD family secretion protein
VAAAFLGSSCNNNDAGYDASGTFESDEIIVSAQATGQLLRFDVEDGKMLQAGENVGAIDSVQLDLTRRQLTESQKAILAGRPDTKRQIAATERQIEQTMLDRQRMENLVKANVASTKQLDDINTRIAVLQAQLEAQKTTLHSSTSTLDQQGSAVSAQLEQVEDQIRKCTILNPVAGTVIVSYVHAGEIAITGRPLYKIADLTEVILRAYITGDQLTSVKLGQKVNVFTDEQEGKQRNYEGVVKWISNKAEFTPKTIQTKNERANLVYAVKVGVKNDGYIKLGMYGEIKF